MYTRLRVKFGTDTSHESYVSVRAPSTGVCISCGWIDVTISILRIESYSRIDKITFFCYSLLENVMQKLRVSNKFGLVLILIRFVIALIIASVM